MNRSFSLFLLVLYVAVLLRPVYPLADYLMHREQIVQQYCENKNKPAMHCNGKCHLMKEMKKATEETPRNHATPVVLENLLPHFAASQLVFGEQFAVQPFIPSFVYQASFSAAHPLAVFHPPSC